MTKMSTYAVWIAMLFLSACGGGVDQGVGLENQGGPNDPLNSNKNNPTGNSPSAKKNLDQKILDGVTEMVQAAKNSNTKFRLDEIAGKWTDPVSGLHPVITVTSDGIINIDMGELNRVDASGHKIGRAVGKFDDQLFFKVNFPDDKEFVGGYQSGNKIFWSNGTFWTRGDTPEASTVPKGPKFRLQDIAGSWTDESGRHPVIAVDSEGMITVDMRDLNRTDATGRKIGRAIGNFGAELFFTVIFPDDKRYTGGYQNGDKIYWSNGTIWTRNLDTAKPTPPIVSTGKTSDKAESNAATDKPAGTPTAENVNSNGISQADVCTAESSEHRLSGQWLDMGGQKPQIKVLSGGKLCVDMSSMKRPTATGVLVNENMIKVNFPDDASFYGCLNGASIYWSNGTVWTNSASAVQAVEPPVANERLDGNWKYENFPIEAPISVSADGKIKIDMSAYGRPNAFGEFATVGGSKSVTNFSVNFPDDATYSGFFSGNVIRWSNGTVWNRSTVVGNYSRQTEIDRLLIGQWQDIVNQVTSRITKVDTREIAIAMDGRPQATGKWLNQNLMFVTFPDDTIDGPNFYGCVVANKIYWMNQKETIKVRTWQKR